MKRIGIVTFLAVQLVAQNPVVRQGTSPTGDVDFSSAKTTKPVRTGGTLPGSCVANELFFLTNVGLQQCVKGKFSAVGNGGTWGTVGGAIAAQTDLWNTLQNKQTLLKGTPSQYVRGDGSMGSLEGNYEPVDAGILRSGSTYVNPSWTRFRSGGSGAVARTVDSKLSDLTSVKDFGAAGDGARDDTASIQAAHSAVCAAGGGELLYPAGTYLISPTAGSGAGTFRICSNMHVTLAAGAKVLVKPNAGDYFALYLPTTPSTVVDNFAISGPGTVDQNAYNNFTANIVAGDSDSQQAILAIYKGTNSRVNGLRLMVSGANSIIANGALISGVDISNNHFTFQKRAAQANFNNSVVYISGTNWHVNNNTFETTLADASVTAIEIHLGLGSVVGNTINMYSKAMNVVDTAGASVTGNTINNAGSCIVLWSDTLQSNTNVSGNGCNINNVDRQLSESIGIGTQYVAGLTGAHANLSIVNNVITYQRESAARDINPISYMGISLQCMCTAVTNAIVRDNLIVNAPVRAISIGSLTSAVSNITVQNNVVVDPGSNISPLATAYSAGISYNAAGTDVNISNNIIRFTTNPIVGLNSLYIYGTGLTLSRVYVYGNLVTAVNGSPGAYYDPRVVKNSPLISTVGSTGSYGDLVDRPAMASTTALLKGDGLGGTTASPITDDGTNLRLAGRNLSVGTTILAEGSVPVNVKAYGAKGDGITDDRPAIQTALNAASAQGGGVVYFPAPGVYSICSSTNPGYPLDLPDKVSLDGPGTIKVCNTFPNIRALFHASQSNNTSFKNLTYDGNAVNNPVNTQPAGSNERQFIGMGSGSNVTVQGMNFINGNDVQTLALNNCDNCFIIGNHWSNMGIGGIFNHDSSEIYLTGKNGVVSNNTFKGMGVGVRTAIEVHQDGKTISGNIIDGYAVCVIASANQAIARNLVITGNTCANAYLGIQLWAVDGAWDGAMIANNQISINRAGPWGPSLSESGISSYPANTFPLSNINISGNTIKFIADTLATNALGGGISFTATTGELTSLSIKNNSINGSYCAGITVQGSFAVTGLDISGNSIINSGTTANATTNCWLGYRSGIGLFNTSLWTGSVVKNNTISDTQAVPTMQYGTYFNGVSGDNVAAGLTFDGNVVTYKGTPAMTTPYHMFAGTTPAFRLNIPNFSRSSPPATGTIDAKFPALGSTIYDPKNGRTYTQSIATGVWFTSSETLTAVPGSGVGYWQGDSVRSSQSNGTVGGWTYNGSAWIAQTNASTAPISMLTVPPHLRFLGDGSDGAIVCTAPTIGVKFATTFTIPAGQTCSASQSNAPLTIYATGACTIAGTLNARGVDGGTSSPSGGDGGGSGGGGGGGAAVGTAGTVSSTFFSFSVAGGSGGASTGGAGGAGGAFSDPSSQRKSMLWARGGYLGGARGGAGGSGGGGQGAGGQAVILVCGSINFTGTIDVSGAPGANAPGNSTGAGGGGGGGYVWLLGRDSVVNTGTIAVTGGAGGSCASFTTCGLGGAGGAGWSKVAQMQ